MLNTGSYAGAARRLRALSAAALLAVPAGTQALIFYDTADTNHNTTAPSGSLANSGWQWQGRFAQYLGTPVAPHYFLTAAHFGGATNWPFTYGGTTYTATAYFSDPGSDLRLWRVRERFPSYAPLYTGSNEAGQPLVVFGRGKTRGADVSVEGALKGWQWGVFDGTMRWGQNTVSAAGGGLLRADFDRTGGTNECHLADKDSGGAVFIYDGGAWRLAGINFTVDGPYSTNSTGSNSFLAALFDTGGLYEWHDPDWVLVKDRPQDKPNAFYATRVSERFAWITNTIPADEFDLDADGLPDTWELRYAGDRTAMSPTDNADGDPSDNLQEFTADTDPTNAASFPRVINVTVAAGTASVVYTSSSSRWYRAESLTGTPAAVAWQALGPAVEGTGPTGTWHAAVDPASIGTGVFVRVRSLLP